MDVTVDYKEVILNAVARSYINLNSFDKKTGLAVSKAMYKAFKVTSSDMKETLNQTAMDALYHAVGIIAEQFGFDSGPYSQGYIGFDVSGNSTREHAASIHENGAAAWDAGRSLAIEHGFDVNQWKW